MISGGDDARAERGTSEATKSLFRPTNMMRILSILLYLSSSEVLYRPISASIEIEADGHNPESNANSALAASYAESKTFDPISVTDNMNPAGSLMESLSRGEIDSSSHLSELAKLIKCPSYGPSIVPRRIDELSLDAAREMQSNITTSEIIVKPSNKLASVGRSHYLQHQLVNLNSKKSLHAGSVRIPPSEEAKKRRIMVDYSKEQTELRIMFDSSSLSARLHDMGQNFAAVDTYTPTKSRITAFSDEIFPAVASTWRILQVYSSLQNLFPHVATCGNTTIPKHHIQEGVADADVLIYIETRDDISCSVDSRPEIGICHFDQNMRPLIGSLSICLDAMDLQDGKAYQKEILHHTALLSNLVGRFLGLSPNLFQYFRDPTTDQLWGERKVEISCDNNQSTQAIMLSNIIQQRILRDEEPFYEISTPTVKQVVRNHFDCQTLTGARLASPLPDLNNDGECTFFNLDLRFHFDEDMTSISSNPDRALAISPLSLALLEDSSWYKANYAAATTPSFGRGAGCGFVESPCITGGNIPDYSAGYFCATVDPPGVRSGCDYTHQNKASCDLLEYVHPPEDRQYFLPSNSEFGSPFDDMHYCPMRSRHPVSCSSNGRTVATIIGESFGETSKCFETDASIPVCLETVCNPVDMSMSVIVNGKSFPCSYFGHVINAEVGYSVICPRIASVCPDLICPSNCSGKGVCDYCLEIPRCICEDPFDETSGCYGNTKSSAIL